MSYESRLPHIAAEIAAKMDAVTLAVATTIANGAKGRVAIRTRALRDAIHVERRGVGQHEVLAGNGDAFYGHIVEHGGAHTPARPFLAPAIEAARGKVHEIGMRALGDL